MDNITVNNVKATSNSFITLREESKLFIRNSQFTNMYSLGNGGVITGGASKTETIIEN